MLLQEGQAWLYQHLSLCFSYSEAILLQSLTSHDFEDKAIITDLCRKEKGTK